MAAKKRKRRFVPKNNEPVWDPSLDEEKQRTQLSHVLNWYNANYDKKKSRQWFLDYVKAKGFPKEKIQYLKSVPDSFIPGTAGAVSRLVLSESENLPDNLEPYLEKTIEQLSEKGKVIYLEKKKKSNTPKKSVQELVQEKLNGYLGQIDEIIDEFVANKCKSDFELESWLQANEVKPLHAKNIAEFYTPLQQELKLALSGKDEQLVEGYSYLKKAELKRFVQFINAIVENGSDYHEKKLKKKRRTRRRKEKTPSQLTAKVQYLEKTDELGGLTSEHPRKLIGASQVWLYNVKYKTLHVYHALDGDGFSVKGTTLQNFDEKKSQGKRLRKPQEIVPKVMEAGKVTLRKILPELRTKDLKATGRINKDTILLRILK